MKKYHGGVQVPKGVYLNLLTGEFLQLYDEARVLPEGGRARYIKVPAALAIMTGPLAGLVFVIFLPLVGIIGISVFLIYKVWRGTIALGRKVFQPVAIEQEVGIAYLTQQRGAVGKEKQKAKETGEGPGNAGIEHIADEVARRRQQGEK